MQLSETSLSHASPQPPASLGAWDYWDVNLSLSFPSWAPNVSIWVHCCCSLHIVLTLVTRVSHALNTAEVLRISGAGVTLSSEEGGDQQQATEISWLLAAQPRMDDEHQHSSTFIKTVSFSHQHSSMVLNQVGLFLPSYFLWRSNSRPSEATDGSFKYFHFHK